MAQGRVPSPTFEAKNLNWWKFQYFSISDFLIQQKPKIISTYNNNVEKLFTNLKNEFVDFSEYVWIFFKFSYDFENTFFEEKLRL